MPLKTGIPVLQGGEDVKEQQKFEAWADAYQMRPAGWTEACWNAWQARASQDRSAYWQPIEMAPKDGTAILVSDGWRTHCVEWFEEFEWWGVDDNKLGPFRLRGAAPTHWMPLPPPPKGTP